MSLTPPPIHVDEAVGIIRESSFAAGGAPNIWHNPISNQFKRKPNRKSIGGATGSMAEYTYTGGEDSRYYEGMTDISGPISIHGEYDDIGHWLSAVFGDPSTSNDDPVVGAHTHTWTLKRATPSATPQSLAVARVGGNEDRLAVGCLPNGMTVRATQENLLQFSFPMLGQQGMNTEVADTATGFSTAPWMEFMDTVFKWDAAAGTANGSLTDQTGAKSIRSWEFTVDMRLRVEQAAGDGERGPREFTYTGPTPSLVTVERDDVDDQFFNSMFAADTAPEDRFNSLALQVTSPHFITGTTPYSFDIFMRNGLLMGEPSEFSGEGVIPENLRWSGADDGTNNIVIITLVNGTGGTDPYST